MDQKCLTSVVLLHYSLLDENSEVLVNLSVSYHIETANQTRAAGH